MRIRLILASLFAASTAACASAMDAMREGQPVHDTTIDALYSDPGAWDGKWVRVSGWIDKKATLIELEKGGDRCRSAVHLDPKLKLHDYSPCGEPAIAAVVSGRVDYTCAFGWAEVREATQGLMVDPHYPEGPLFYCNVARGPNLVNVIVSRTKGANR